jgi:transposase-like protein
MSSSSSVFATAVVSYPETPPFSASPKTPSSTRRHSNDVSFKLLIVQWHRRNRKNVSKTAREFDIDRKRARGWDSRYECLLEHNVGKEKKRIRIGSGRPPHSINLDQKLFIFLEEERAEGRPVSNKCLKAMSLQLAGGLIFSQKAAPF